MKKGKATIFVSILLVILAICVTGFSGCFHSFEYGDLIYDYYDMKAKDTLYIAGLTEEGMQKEHVYVPTEINGLTVVSIGRLPRNCSWESEVLEKAFFQCNFTVESDLFIDCRKLKKLFAIDIDISLESSLFVFTAYKSFIANDIFYVMKNMGNVYLGECSPANISYNYNYEGSTNYGIYFIDDCDYGGKIEYIPAEPTRDGYTFGGWYKEAECQNKWDFATDTLPEELTETNEDGETEIVYQETKLYAKWL